MDAPEGVTELVGNYVSQHRTITRAPRLSRPDRHEIIGGAHQRPGNRQERLRAEAEQAAEEAALAEAEAAGLAAAQGGGGGTYITVNVEGSVSSERELVESIRKWLLRSQQSGRSVVLN